MLRWLLLLFVAVPLAELYLLVWLSGIIGFWETLAITLLTGIVGGGLARREGLRVWRGWNAALASGRSPEAGIVDGMLVLLGGAFLITPGVVTDVVGLCLLLPFTRRPMARLVRAVAARELSRRVVSVASWGHGAPAPGRRASAGSNVIETTGVESGDPP